MSRPPEGAFHRAPRPLVGWVTVVLVLGLVLFLLAIMAAIATGFWLTAARGQTVPNLTGGIENFGTLLIAVFGAGGLGGLWMQSRSRERRDEIAFGGAPQAPFPPSPPSTPPPVEPQHPDGGLVNNEAIR